MFVSIDLIAYLIDFVL
jgi:hypothetical protein